MGDTVYFLSDNYLCKGFINEIIINVRPGILERYEVKYLNRISGEITENINADSLFESEKDLVDKLMLDFEKAKKNNE